MKKTAFFKIAAMLLTMALVFGTVGIAAYADECPNGGNHDWVVIDDTDAAGHVLQCSKCSGTKTEAHDTNGGPVYVGQDLNKFYYHSESSCSVCGYADTTRYAENRCTLVYTPKGDGKTHTITCTECDLSIEEGCTEAPVKYDADQPDGAHCHYYPCEKCGQRMMKSIYFKEMNGEPFNGWINSNFELHEMKWSLAGDRDRFPDGVRTQTLFKGNKMRYACWCGYEQFSGVDAEELWANPETRKEVSIDDLSYIHQFGLWIAGTGSFLARVAVEPIRLVVNLFYHIDILD